MDFLTFRERMYPMGCFNINQVLLWEKDFDRNNLTRWCKNGHREERLLLKIEAQDQGIRYQQEIATVNRMGFFFNIQTPPVDVLCAMKFAAILSRQKGRDFYDAIFLLSKTKPNMEFLQKRVGINTIDQLRLAVDDKLKEIDLNQKKRDFQHLLFNESNADRILSFNNCLSSL